MNVIAVLIIVFVSLCAFLFMMAFLLKKQKTTAKLIINQRYKKEQIILEDVGVNYFGMQSKGNIQVRGNGILVLSDVDLFFIMLLPQQELIIPTSSITSLSTPKSFLGKTKGRELLCVTFVVDGVEDSVAWLVSDLDYWKEILSPYAVSEA